MQREKKTEIITLRVHRRPKTASGQGTGVWPDRHRLPVPVRAGQEDRPGGGLDKVLSELKAQGRNLNQLTTLANMGKVNVVYGDRLAESYAQVSEQLYQLLREVSNGAPARAQRSGSCGERRHPGMSEL